MRFVKTVENLFGLPAGFIRVEYLESTGTQYIDTGYKPVPATTKFEFYFSPTTISGNYFLFGSRPNTSIGSETCTTYFATGNIRQDWAGLSTYFTKTNAGAKVLYSAYNNTVSLNDNSVTGTVVRSTNRLDYNFLLFTVNTGGTVDDRMYVGRVYYAKLWDNGTLVRDYIPCLDPLGVPCMYDLVGKKPYYNQGTGDFTTGRQIIPVEYLEGTGTQYIDTGVRGFADFEIGIKLRENISNVSIFCGNAYRLERYNASNPYWRFRNDNDFYNSGVPITEYHIMSWKNDEVYADGVKLQDFAKTWNVSANMTLFGASASGSYPSMIYFCKLWNPTNGTLLRDYIPCKDENDSGFLFDKVSGVCYLNNGTGNFAFGENKYKTKLRLIKDNKLPAGYTQVEYLQSSGTQWIDTGIDVSIANTDVCKVITDFIVFTPPSATGLNAYTGIFGAGSPRFGAYAIYDKICFGYVSAFDNIQSFNFGQKYNLEYTVTKGSQEAKLDGASIWTATNTGTLTNAYKLGLFCRTQSSVQWIQNARIYNFKFYDNGTLIRDYIPALDPSGTPCMYDLVTKAPFYNQGTGTFSYGKTISMVRFIKDIIPREYAAVNYIASTNGYQYINTGYTGNSTTRVIIGASSSLTSSNIPLFGARDTNGYYNSFSIWQNVGANGMRFDYTDTTANVVNSKTWLTTGINIIEKNGRYNYVNGVQVTSNAEKTFSCNNPFYLMSINTSGISMNGFIGSVSFCKIYENNTLVRNFVPVVRRIDKVAGMWDTITKQFFGNSGTGNFNYG